MFVVDFKNRKLKISPLLKVPIGFLLRYRFYYYRFVETELTKHQLDASKRWGFNFLMGYPLPDNNRYMWERVPPTNSIPEMYTLSRAAHVREMPHVNQTDYNELLDERADRSNHNERIISLADKPIENPSTGLTSTVPTATTASANSPKHTSTREKRQPRITG